MPEPPDEPAAASVEAPPPAGTGRRWRPWLRRLAMTATATVTGLVVGVLAVDWGPSLRARAEREGSRLIERPLHIGRLSINLLRGHFVLEDVVIEGLTPQAPAFFTARHIRVVMPWWTILGGEIFIESVVLQDWRMVVETFPDGRHNFIRLPGQGPRQQPRRFVTTVQLVRATRGEFVYEDHATPWSTVARHLELTIARLADYRGEARFRGGTISIQGFEPMWADMACTFRIDGGRVVLDRIDLDTDGARSKVTGVVDFGRWPEQRYEVVSTVQFPRMKDIWFAGQTFTLAGEGEFRGTFALYKGGRDLEGSFRSRDAGFNGLRFPDLQGRLRWLRDRFEVTDTTARFHGGRLRLGFSMAPLGDPARPGTGTLDVTYEAVDLLSLTTHLDLRGLRLDGRARGRTLLRWPLGRFADRAGEGHLAVTPPEGTGLMARQPLDVLAAADVARGVAVGPFDPTPLADPLAVGGEIRYTVAPETLAFAPSWAATPQTFVAFEGTTVYGRESRFPFHVTSGDWQESDRVLAAIIRAVTGSGRAVPVGGAGTFDGVMTGSFADPRVEGRFVGEGMRAWDVTWGRADGTLVVEDNYVRIAAATVTKGAGRMDITGTFSLGYPRRDGGEELDARVHVAGWPLVDFRHAFGLDAYPVTGTTSGEFHLYDRYERPQGFGRLRLEAGEAYGERFDEGTAALTFDGRGVQLAGIEIRKATGRIRGVAYIDWRGTYSFQADGTAIPVEAIDALRYPQAPLSGTCWFTASGTGAFAAPRYEVRGRIDDLFIADEGIGQLTGALTVRDGVLTIDLLEVASSRLAISGSGRVALTPEADADLRFRVTDTSLDPYLRALRPGLSPFTTAVASGTVRLFGELRTADRFRAEVVVEELDLRLFDYAVRNEGTLRISLDRQVVRLDRLLLVGQDTRLELSGEAALPDRRIDLRVTGDANLGILQGFFRDVRSGGAAELRAEVRGTLDAPVISGTARVVNGRFRHFALPHALEQINGQFAFDRGGLRLDGVTGRLGGGEVWIGGRVSFRGFVPDQFSLIATGQDMRVRYPEGFRSVLDADLALRGDVSAPVLSGDVVVKSAVYERAFDPAAAPLFRRDQPGRDGPAPATEASGFPLRFDLRIDAPGTLRIENRAARLQSTAELTLRGTYDRPQLFGRVEVTRGDVIFEGNRYQVTRGTIDFASAQRIEPFFDVEAETRVRVPGQVYTVVFRVTGVPDRFVFDLTSDPPLSTVDILALLFGEARDPQNAELQALRTPGRTEQELIAAGAARLLASPISSEVGRVVERTLGVDTVQIAPSLGDLSALQAARITPSARVTLGKRVSERLYVTYSRALSPTARDQIILLEYDQSDRLSWIVSQNEDATFAVDVRVRHVIR